MSYSEVDKIQKCSGVITFFPGAISLVLRSIIQYIEYNLKTQTPVEEVQVP